MPSVENNGTTIYFEQYGSRADTPLVLIHGLGCQLMEWPPSFINALTAGGYRVVTPDNRDIGLSSRLTHLDERTPEVMELMARQVELPLEGFYSLSDMTADVVAVLDYLGQSGAHVLGLSMGGMIAQRMAIEYPERCFSLTCLMTCSSPPDTEAVDTEAAMAFFGEPAALDQETLIRHRAAGWDAVGGSHFLSSECGIGQLAAEAVNRCYHRKGFARQLHAISSDVDRTPLLADVRLPTLVIHGEVDPLLPLSSGEEIAEAVPGAEFVPIKHMGHDLPEPLIQPLAEQVLRHVDAASVER